MMYIVYILYSKEFDKTYVGFTQDIEKRLRAHNARGSRLWTKRYQPWLCVYKETYETKDEALKRERFYKSGKGRAIINEWRKEWDV